MRLHGVHSFNSYPLVVRTGGMLNAFGHPAGRKVTHPDTGTVTLACEGFNQKNEYPRETPCDQDYLRKFARDSDALKLMAWFNREVVSVLRERRTLDKEGILIGDGSYLFVPDNPKYENSVRMRFDEHSNPVSKEAFQKKTDGQKARCRWRRCCKMGTLLHTNRKLELFLILAVTVVFGKANECPVLYGLVKHLVDVAGKTEVDWIPYEEPVAEPQKLLRPRPKVVLEREKKRQQTLKEKEKPPAPRLPEEQSVRTEVAAIGEFRRWSSCTVPLSVVATRDHYADGHDETSPLLELSLNPLQVYLLREGHKALTGKTLPRIRRQLLPSDSHIIVYWQSYYGFFTPLEFVEIIASLPAPARKKIADKSRRPQRELKESMKDPRPP
jgi:hypothetical protein